MQLAGKVVVITGAARGLGNAFVAPLLRQGAKVTKQSHLRAILLIR